MSAPLPAWRARFCGVSTWNRVDPRAGKLPLTAEMLLDSPSGDLFGLSQNAGMGWDPSQVGRPQFLILGTQGGIRAEDGSPIALGYHTGHYEVGLLVRAAAEELDRLECLPFAGYVSDPCDGRTQGTVGMMDSLPYRNDAAVVLKRLIRSLPTRRGVIGVATCDKGLPAMMMAVAAQRDREMASLRQEILFQSQRAMNEEEFRKAVKSLRERKERERQQQERERAPKPIASPEAGRSTTPTP